MKLSFYTKWRIICKIYIFVVDKESCKLKWWSKYLTFQRQGPVSRLLAWLCSRKIDPINRRTQLTGGSINLKGNGWKRFEVSNYLKCEMI